MDTVGTETASATVELKDAFQLDAEQVKSFLEDRMRTTIGEMLDAEADTLCQTEKYQRTSGKLPAKASPTVGELNLKMPRLRAFPFETQIIVRFRRRQSSVEKWLMEMLLAASRLIANRINYNPYLRTYLSFGPIGQDTRRRMLVANDNDDIILPGEDEDFPVPDNDSGFNQAAPFKVVVQRVTITYSDGKMLPPNPMNIIRYKSD